MKNCLLLLLGVFLGIQNVSAQFDSDFHENIDALVRKRVQDGKAPGMVVGVIDEENKIRFYNYGQLGKNNPTSVGKKTLFEIGSLTQLFTTLGLATMVEQERLSFNMPIGALLPKEFTMPGGVEQRITLEQLATHRSGIPNLPAGFNINKDNPFEGYSSDRLWGYLKSSKINADNIGSYSYSTLGMGLLGELLTQKSNLSYAKTMEQEVLNPLGMWATYVALPSHMKSRMAVGHVNGEPMASWDYAAMAGAGTMKSNAVDLLNFISIEMGVEQTRIQSAIERSQIVRYATDQPAHHVSLGWNIAKNFEDELYWQDNNMAGYSAFIGFNKKRKMGVVVLSNSAVPVNDIGKMILTKDVPAKVVNDVAMSGGSPVPPMGAEIKSPKEKSEYQKKIELLERYVGVYQEPEGALFIVTRVGPSLYVQKAGQSNNRVEMINETRFDFERVGYVTFDMFNDNVIGMNYQVPYRVAQAARVDAEETMQLDADMADTKRRLFVREKRVRKYREKREKEPKANRESRTTRPEEPMRQSRPAVIKPIKVDAEIYENYEGTYKLTERFFIDIYRQGNKLWALLPDQDSYLLTPMTETYYVFEQADGSIEFLLDDTGYFNFARVKLSGSEYTAEKITYNSPFGRR